MASSRSSTLLSGIQRMSEGVYRLFGLIGAATFVFMALMATLQIFFRFTAAYLEYPAFWTNTLARYGLVIMTVAGVPYAARNNDHISMRPLLEYLPDRIENTLIMVSDALIIIVCAVVAVSAWTLIPRTIDQDIQGAVLVTVGHAYVFFLVAFVIAALFQLERLTIDVGSVVRGRRASAADADSDTHTDTGPPSDPDPSGDAKATQQDLGPDDPARGDGDG